MIAEALAALSPFKFYFIGVAGSLGAELTAALRETQNLGGTCPPLYKKPFYLCARGAFALFVAGPLPYFFDAANALTALYMGISAPLIMDRLVKGQIPNKPEPAPEGDQLRFPFDQAASPGPEPVAAPSTSGP